MKILAMDTSNVTLSVAVLDSEQLLAMQTTNIKRNHSKTTDANYFANSCRSRDGTKRN